MQETSRLFIFLARIFCSVDHTFPGKILSRDLQDFLHLQDNSVVVRFLQVFSDAGYLCKISLEDHQGITVAARTDDPLNKGHPRSIEKEVGL